MTLLSPSRRAADDHEPTGPESWWTGVRTTLASPVAPYYLVLGTTLALTLFGLVMVLSASSVRSLLAGMDFWAVGRAQAVFAVLGLVCLLIASRISLPWWKRLAVPVFAVALLLQALVMTPLGDAVGGNRNWLDLGPLRLQPAEVGKFALVLLGAAVLTRKRKVIGRVLQAVVPFLVPLGGLYVGLVLMGRDLGTALVLLGICAGALFGAGVQARWFLLAGGLVGVGAVALVVTDAARMARMGALIGGCTDAHDESAACFQKTHAEYALADGGWWGVGLGASREKWGILPEPHNDFIYAIIGEELGMPGTVTVLVLFVVLAYACYRIIAQSPDFFVRVGTAAIMAWILGQTMINIGSVVGLLPIIGVPLPLVSAGGTALVTTLAAMGLLLAFARSLPGAAEPLARRGRVLRSTLAVLPGRRER